MVMDPEAQRLFVNGVAADTGGYLLPPLPPRLVADVALRRPPSANELADLRRKWDAYKKRKLGPVEGVNPDALEEAGWGVIFAPGVGPEVQEALKPLLDLRRAQAAGRYKEFTGEDAPARDEAKSRFLARHGAGPGPVDPRKVPYYLLLVGDPEALPFTLQYQLDVQYAVGRLHFETEEEYAAYARAVVAAEAKAAPSPPHLTFFGVRNPDDTATTLSSEGLIEPLRQAFSSELPADALVCITGAEATRARLQALLEQERGPGIVFTASHGVGFSCGHPLQRQHQGALLCQDWPGPREWEGELPPRFYFSADDVSSRLKLAGQLFFHFACYGAGSPRWDEFEQVRPGDARTPLAPAPFISRLSQRLLEHGALAVIGHVERAWSLSFHWPGAGSQTPVFESTLRKLLRGQRVGHALEPFNLRQAELAVDLAMEQRELEAGRARDDLALAALWVGHHDARNYLLVGDPAVRLPRAR